MQLIRVYPSHPLDESRLTTVKKFLKRPLKKKTKIGFQYRFWLNVGQKSCRKLPLEHSAILLTFIKVPFVNKIFVLSIFESHIESELNKNNRCILIEYRRIVALS